MQNTTCNKKLCGLQILTVCCLSLKILPLFNLFYLWYKCNFLNVEKKAHSHIKIHVRIWGSNKLTAVSTYYLNRLIIYCRYFQISFYLQSAVLIKMLLKQKDVWGCLSFFMYNTLFCFQTSMRPS